MYTEVFISRPLAIAIDHWSEGVKIYNIFKRTVFVKIIYTFHGSPISQWWDYTALLHDRISDSSKTDKTQVYLLTVVQLYNLMT